MRIRLNTCVLELSLVFICLNVLMNDYLGLDDIILYIGCLVCA